EQRRQELRKHSQRVLRGEPEEHAHHNEVEDRKCRDEESALPEDRAVGLHRSLQHVRLGRHLFADDQRPPDDAQDSARNEHGDDRVDEGPAEAKLQPDERERERGSADEEGEDPEDDHGGVTPSYGVGFLIARNTTIASPTAISTSPT